MNYENPKSNIKSKVALLGSITDEKTLRLANKIKEPDKHQSGAIGLGLGSLEGWTAHQTPIFDNTSPNKLGHIENVWSVINIKSASSISPRIGIGEELEINESSIESKWEVFEIVLQENHLGLCVIIETLHKYQR